MRKLLTDIPALGEAVGYPPKPMGQTRFSLVDPDRNFLRLVSREAR